MLFDDTKQYYGDLAQFGSERFSYKEKVDGSSPSVSTIYDAPFVQWIGHITTDDGMRVRIFQGVQFKFGTEFVIIIIIGP